MVDVLGRIWHDNHYKSHHVGYNMLGNYIFEKARDNHKFNYVIKNIVV